MSTATIRIRLPASSAIRICCVWSAPPVVTGVRVVLVSSHEMPTTGGPSPGASPLFASGVPPSPVVKVPRRLVHAPATSTSTAETEAKAKRERIGPMLLRREREAERFGEPPPPRRLVVLAARIDVHGEAQVALGFGRPSALGERAAHRLDRRGEATAGLALAGVEPHARAVRVRLTRDEVQDGSQPVPERWRHRDGAAEDLRPAEMYVECKQSAHR